MASFDCQRLAKMTATALVSLKERADEFSGLDAETGDGDHGTAIVSAMTAVDRVAQQGTELKKVLGDMGFAAMTESCGSTSTLIGAFFLGMSDGVKGESLNAAETASMFSAGLKKVKEQTKASIGDKTMIDALQPAVDAMPANAENGIPAMLQAAAKAAATGAESTKDMVAKFGRARNLGERVIGHLDAGAVSTACMFDAFARGFTAST
ncbi:DAK2 domain-containing protein [Novipirellula artificiosorum]|uniref:PTS-dependent dihydroxyacetone kinase, ADP-binding subunit DhaL n=1 Tax=Novipirellula artificiosorum TaxID=2528016 RepID=A0A5C6DU11_9BACT|nr:DAK2 domain-containing protein [Novipirellula artificiosorum]TWU39714.1 PTS-dependent dihydroxyacetone kinase, ADP-binding subunit DhaL [Novipirellula artificiosorum]